MPSFADGAAVFVLDRPLAGGDADSGDVIVRRIGTRLTGRGSDGSEVPPLVFPDGAVVAFASDSPYAQCLQLVQPVAFGQVGAGPVERVDPSCQEVAARYGYRSFLAVPIIVGSAPNGLIAFKRAGGRPAFDDGEIAVAAALAEQAGGLLAEAGRALDSGLEVAGRCLPAAGQLSGGDWYDLIPLGAGRTGVIVGDVMGHGSAAATLMAQLRTAAFALASSGLAPADMLRQLDRTAAGLGDVVYATCAYAVIDPADRAATVALAGHLPPVLAMPDGVTRVPELPSGLSLGLGSAAFGQVRVKLPPGAILALFTDGLVETRTQPFDLGIRALRSILASQHGTLHETCQTIVASLAPDLEDDTTVVLVRIPLSDRG